MNLSSCVVVGNLPGTVTTDLVVSSFHVVIHVNFQAKYEVS